MSGDYDAVRVPLTRCPVCGNPNDATTSTRSGVHRGPKQGDYAICFGCGVIMEFDVDLRCFIPEPEDVAANLMNHPDTAKRMMLAQEAVFAKNKRRSHH